MNDRERNERLTTEDIAARPADSTEEFRSDEDLRVALRHYRSFFDRLLAI